MATEEGQAALGRILLAFSVHKPQIGYCQSMNYIAALLLIVLERNEENAFWVLVSLIDDDGVFLQLSQPQILINKHLGDAVGQMSHQKQDNYIAFCWIIGRTKKVGKQVFKMHI